MLLPPPRWCGAVSERQSSTGMISVNTITSLKALAQNGGIGFQQPDQHGPDRRQRIAARPPMMAATKPLRPIRKPLS